MKRYLFVVVGSISLFLGLLGLLTPGLPTTPFILLTGTLYAKGSPKLYKKLQENKLTGRYLKRIEVGLSWKARLFSMLLMWCMVVFIAFFVFSEESKMRYVMLALGLIGTISQWIIFRGNRHKNVVIQSSIDTQPNNIKIDCINEE